MQLKGCSNSLVQWMRQYCYTSMSIWRFLIGFWCNWLMIDVGKGDNINAFIPLLLKIILFARWAGSNRATPTSTPPSLTLAQQPLMSSSAETAWHLLARDFFLITQTQTSGLKLQMACSAPLHPHSGTPRESWKCLQINSAPSSKIPNRPAQPIKYLPPYAGNATSLGVPQRGFEPAGYRPFTALAHTVHQDAR